ncbi:MAG: sugar ABC transporter permease [Ruminococcus flavefaciens]|nr:sugar ABC transporter permease [Ruminococcus flavefaciens]MCM1228563.1 sugar ABC transporter permease [Ruminococcus flavefaciens]
MAKKMTYQKRKELWGYGFIGLWLVGTVIFFLIPLVQSLWWSFNKVTIDTGKSVTEWTGLANYYYALGTDEKYMVNLKDTLVETLWKTPLILIFSLFTAVILNQKFRGRTLARAVFFLPVIIATGPVYEIISGDISRTGNTGAGQFSTLFSTDLVGELLQFLGIYGISEDMNQVISGIADNIFGIVWSSGIQILLFLGALQNIPKSAKEAALIEGADGWVFFWKITFPYVSPFVTANLIFTVIDTFTSPVNPVMKRILTMRSDFRFGEASAMAWIYFGIILASIGLTLWVIRKSNSQEMRK